MGNTTGYTIVHLSPDVLCGFAVLSVLQLLVIVFTVLQVLRTVRATGRIVDASTAAIVRLNATTEELGRQVHDAREEARRPGDRLGRMALAPVG